ncbi:MAG: alpha/beta hydrolase [Gammaproteobacteria bacterium]|nr:alpha/beta hydrolase [Gammaproteobacteria bacterium]MCP4927867.1 alpha/beta hydrolase [Gammaproteobacteria bacterium]
MMSSPSYHLVNVWTDTETGAGGFKPMAASMLWLPGGHQVGHPAPAFVYVHRWGGYPHDPVPVALGPQLAAEGYGFLSLSLRRRGMEGQLAALPANDLRDIKLALDYLHMNGFNQLYLIGEEIGCISVLNYMAQHRDSRVAGVGLLAPVEAPADWLRAVIGDEVYQEQIRYAGVSARQGTGMDVRIDLLPQEGPVVTQNALAFLSWWGPMAGFKLDHMLEAVTVPLLVVADPDVLLPEALEAETAKNSQALRRLNIAGDSAALLKALNDFACDSGAVVLAQSPIEMVHIQSAGQPLFALFWPPADGKAVKTVTLLMHGLTSSPLSPLFCKMAPVLAQTGTAVIAVESRRSGWAGHETALLEYDTEDIDAWVTYLLERGFEKIVLAGASIGSISVGRYQSVKQHPNVVAIAHLMPTADCPDWFRRGAGDGPYAKAVAQASTAIALGQGDKELIDIDIRQPLPNKYGGRFRWTQRAASWLSWWGPDADSVNSQHIANAHVPLLLLSGTEDSYNDMTRFTELKEAAVNAPSVDQIWYPDIDHGLVGVETKVAEDLYAWMRQIGVI